ENGILEVKLCHTVRSGGTYTILFSEEDLTTEFDSVVSPSTRVASSTEHYYDGNSLYFSFELAPLTPNELATANYFDSLPTTGLDPAVTDLLDALDGLSLDPYLDALHQLMPEAYDAQAAATLELANAYTDLMLSRPNYCVAQPNEDSRHPTTDLACRKRPFEPWASVYGQKHKRTGSDQHISYHDEGGGLVVGLDHRVDHRLLLSGSLATAYDIIHVDDVGKGRLTTVDLGFAGSWADGPLRIQGVASYGYGWNQRYRNLDFTGSPVATKAEYGMSRIGLRGRAEYAFRFGHLLMAPLVSLDYTALIRPVITETGGGAADLYIEGATNNITTVRVGVDLSSALHKKGYWTDILENADGVWRPNLSLAWRQVVTGQHREITSRLAQVRGNVFTIQADAADRGFEIGAGIDWSPARINRFSFGIHYDAFVWKNVLNQSVAGRLRFSF
ncbi:MAG: autotransporter outer membrane beta-barrel domain-containing protein, partial [Myxococcota bacterium]